MARGNEKYESRERYITALFGGGMKRRRMGMVRGRDRGDKVKR